MFTKRLISILLAATMFLTAIPVTPTTAITALTKQYVMYATGGSSLQLNTSNTSIDGNIYTGGNLDAYSAKVDIDGKGEAVGRLNKHEHTVFDAVQFVGGMPYDAISVNDETGAPEVVTAYSLGSEKREYEHFTQAVMDSLGNNYQAYQWWHGIHGTDVSNDSSIYVQNGGFQITGSTITVQDTIIADNSILISGSTALNTAEDKEVNLFVPNGNIGIYVESIDINGVIYAPNGTVQICGTDININGVIIAKEIMISAENFTITENYDLSLAEYIMTGVVEPFEGVDIYGDFLYTNNGSFVTIVGFSTPNYNRIVSIPAQINGLPVRKIGAGAFMETDITFIVIPDGVTEIDSFAFEKCSALSAVTIPESVEQIGYGAFNESGLLAVHFADNNSKPLESKAKLRIDIAAFAHCTELTEITLPDRVTSLGSFAFTKSGLMTANIGAGIKSIASGAFEDCANLTTVNLPDSLESIGASAFYNCVSLVGIDIPAGVSVADNAFAVDDIFENTFEILEETTPIGTFVPGTEIGAFIQTQKIKMGDWIYDVGIVNYGGVAVQIYAVIIEYTGNGTNVTIPSLLLAAYLISDESSERMITSINSIAIGKSAFENNNRIKSIVINNNVYEINANSFNGCTSLTDLSVENNNKFFSCVDGVLFNKKQTQLIRYPEGKSQTSYTIPDDVSVIEDSAFYGTQIKELTINSKEIKNMKFQNMNKLEKIFISNTVKNIDSFEIEDCPKFNTLEINMPKISKNAFKSIEELKTLIIGEFVSEIGEDAFYGCLNLEKVEIGKTLKIIKEYAFAYCNSLTSIEIPDSVTDIYEYAFLGCASLKTVTFNNEVPPELDDTVFAYCDIETIYVPSGAKVRYKDEPALYGFNIVCIKCESSDCICVCLGHGETDCVICCPYCRNLNCEIVHVCIVCGQKDSCICEYCESCGKLVRPYSDERCKCCVKCGEIIEKCKCCKSCDKFPCKGICEVCNKCNVECESKEKCCNSRSCSIKNLCHRKYGDVTGENKINLYDMIMILKFLINVENNISNNYESIYCKNALPVSLIVSICEPTIYDAIEIIIYMAGMECILKDKYGTYNKIENL
ncbi:MAG: leucine-rich repeat domain-containing protein [Oscillospiraceae bacterium]|nr:leucine-rich repeat domain-containing protein [Oscillospiraceae bacterium]